ncbi:MAG: methyltransferase domain-containing protein, partial [Armatimonadota bacterium]
MPDSTSNDSVPIARTAYDALAESFDAKAATKPHNAYYERPATLSLLPQELSGLRILDAGCGPGHYAEHFARNGTAKIVAVDASPNMVRLASQRLSAFPETAFEFYVADLAHPLSFLADNTIDLVVSPLVLEYVRDWAPVFQEFFRVLAPGGSLVVSVTHPFFDYTYFQSEQYFEVEYVECVWRGFGPTPVTMPSYRRPLSEVLNPLLNAGLILEKLVEPLPTVEFAAADPEGHKEL